MRSTVIARTRSRLRWCPPSTRDIDEPPERTEEAVARDARRRTRCAPVVVGGGSMTTLRTHQKATATSPCARPCVADGQPARAAYRRRPGPAIVPSNRLAWPTKPATKRIGGAIVERRAACRPGRCGRRACTATRSRERQRLVLVVRDEQRAMRVLALDARGSRRASSVRVAASSAESGSSSSSACGPKTSARASATRCCWPPDSWPGSDRRSAPSPTLSSIASARRAARRRDAAHAQRIGDVLPDPHVRKQRIALEDDAALAGARAATRRRPGRRS